jgi:hypothetical protein
VEENVLKIGTKGHRFPRVTRLGSGQLKKGSLMFRFLLDSRFGFIVGAIMGLMLSIYGFFFLQRFHQRDIAGMEWFWDFVILSCIPFVLSCAISGSLIEGVIIKKMIRSIYFLSLYKIGSIIGCLLGSTCFFCLLLSMGLLLGNLIGGLPGQLMDNRFVLLLGRFFGVTAISIGLILFGSFIGLFLGAVTDSLARVILKVGRSR